MLNYIAIDPQVQIAFLLVTCIVIIALLFNRRVAKAEQNKQDEKSQERRDRFAAIPGPGAQQARSNLSIDQ